MNEVEDVLAHFGVKGMKWGQRKADKKAAKATAKSEKQVRKADAAWAKNVGKGSTQIAIYNNAADAINSKHNDAFNAKWDKSGKPYGKEYYRAYSQMAEKVFQKAADDYVGPSASGKLKLKVHYDMEEGFPIFEITEREAAKHDDGSIFYKGVLNPNKSINKVVPMAKDVIHNDLDDEIEDFLAHYGVKGMKWGQRMTKGHQKKVDRLRRVQNGSASGRDKARVALSEVSAINLARSGSLQKAAGAKADYVQKRIDNINAGNSVAKNIIQLYGATTLPGFVVRKK